MSDILLPMSLIDKVKQGNSVAILLFYQRFSPKIATYLKRKLPQGDAEEILNDVFLEAIDAISMLKNEKHVLSWLYKIAHNKIVDFYRKKKVISFLLSQIPLLEIVAKEVYEPEFQFEKDRLREKIEETLHRMSENQQRILRLHYQEAIPVKQLALQMNLSFKATESLLFRARKNFQIIYERT